jgi:hypothetical protein
VLVRVSCDRIAANDLDGLLDGLNLLNTELLAVVGIRSLLRAGGEQVAVRQSEDARHMIERRGSVS